ncbi:MAG: succinylglutamate desuccinylase/aspartoacylase [uncultured bacterium]|uniref:Succinylglutamate desuccinylase / Aspartoacylase family protein n=3 Tax=Candidatus Daviesiibacteriota TaxID=1752718 RepID=A0A0G0HEE7_9BACT|nr:MAG: succinylglutamate desuccinylase/aspartoacylase [uncultured bacterium]KKQ10489.1 MAG: Succinylglutamate desuccinylase / Aspartoacylase family protein [Candidatus Daviesbacteria bacterium GW2011_GWB1_36_5]KKQ15670.1 MAG: Succinylglutamate desuccinylase / Aspartoacylase family protein [Candidatus Daviesbacteria bacterium GW2011_GWA1_36_8]OGE32606.1 MAG: hypothetical protein A3C99_01930 [Candidatus Daviesbacteria bacterium RIFCSPHIGHO2_02_FULL_37_9]OGE36195.1 MAG: hypothetical protein A3E66
MNTIFVVCQHGGEKAPYKVINKYFKKFKLLIANKEAFDNNVRFIESDLNRAFPGNPKGTKEEKLASKLLKQLKKYEAVLDFHTATDPSELFIITTKLTPNHLTLINKLNTKKVVYMQNSIASGKSLIDHVDLGISLEVGGKSESTKKEVKKFIEDYLKNYVEDQNKEYFVVFDVLLRESKNEKLSKEISAFKLVKKGFLLSSKGKNNKYSQKDFYPILPREKSYPNILCLMAKKVSLTSLLRGGDDKWNDYKSQRQTLP